MAEKAPYQAQIISAILGAEPSINKIILFGSRARHAHHPHSDIDIGLFADQKLSTLQLARIDEALSSIETLYTIDVVDFTGKVDRFATEALTDTKILYEERHTA